MGINKSLKTMLLPYGFLLLGGLLTVTLTSCGSSEEATTTEEGMQEERTDQTLGEQPAKKEEDPNQAALTSFIGAAPKKEEAKKEEPAAPQPSPATELQRQIDDLRAENTSLKQKIVKLEQDNRSLTARLADTEAKLMAEKERADKALESARTVATRGGQVTDAAAGAPTPSAPTAMTKPASVSPAAYNDALKLFKSKNYDATINTLQGLIDGGIADDLKDNCYYWKGEAYFAKRNYTEAIKNFEKVLEFRKSEKKADAQFMIAQSYDRMGNKAKAKEAYEKVVKDYPTSSKVQRAKERWAKL